MKKHKLLIQLPEGEEQWVVRDDCVECEQTL